MTIGTNGTMKEAHAENDNKIYFNSEGFNESNFTNRSEDKIGEVKENILKMLGKIN